MKEQTDPNKIDVMIDHRRLPFVILEGLEELINEARIGYEYKIGSMIRRKVILIPRSIEYGITVSGDFAVNITYVGPQLDKVNYEANCTCVVKIDSFPQA